MSEDVDFADYTPAHGGEHGGGMSVRPATRADAAAVAALFCERHGGAVADTAQRIADHFTLIAEGLPDYVCVAEIDGAVVGYAKCGHRAMGALRAENLPDGFYLAGVYTTPRHRRRGVGHRLTLDRLHWIEPRADAAFYSTDTVNEASIALHQEMGFLEVRRDVLPPGGAPRETDQHVLFRKTFR
jgi:ribosomal protein S18 acetylase RimI-like enzyme